jgi:hypothetical protein
VGFMLVYHGLFTDCCVYMDPAYAVAAVAAAAIPNATAVCILWWGSNLYLLVGSLGRPVQRLIHHLSAQDILATCEERRDTVVQILVLNGGHSRFGHNGSPTTIRCVKMREPARIAFVEVEEDREDRE